MAPASLLSNGIGCGQNSQCCSGNCFNGICQSACQNPGCGTVCPTNPDCVCVLTTENVTACVKPYCSNIACSNSERCGSSQVCNVGCCGGGGICIPRC